MNIAIWIFLSTFDTDVYLLFRHHFHFNGHFPGKPKLRGFHLFFFLHLPHVGPGAVAV